MCVFSEFGVRARAQLNPVLTHALDWIMSYLLLHRSEILLVKGNLECGAAWIRSATDSAPRCKIQHPAPGAQIQHPASDSALSPRFSTPASAPRCNSPDSAPSYLSDSAPRCDSAKLAFRCRMTSSCARHTKPSQDIVPGAVRPKTVPQLAAETLASR